MGKEPKDYDDVTGFARLAKDLNENYREDDPQQPDNSEPSPDEAEDRPDSNEDFS